jgi:transcription elongation factor/antiterminator RfaH
MNGPNDLNGINGLNDLNGFINMKETDQRNWFVVRTKAGDEHRANTNLLHQEIETFLPLFKNHYFRSGRMIQTVKPLFPNYLFAKLDLDLQYAKVKWTRGVSRILGNREGPVPISGIVVQTIQDRIGKDNLIELEEEIKEGDLVQVTSGPLKDLVGVFQKRMSGKDRVKILLNLIGVDVPVQISKWQIHKVA